MCVTDKMIDHGHPYISFVIWSICWAGRYISFELKITYSNPQLFTHFWDIWIFTIESKREGETKKERDCRIVSLLFFSLFSFSVKKNETEERESAFVYMLAYIHTSICATYRRHCLKWIVVLDEIILMKCNHLLNNLSSFLNQNLHL